MSWVCVCLLTGLSAALGDPPPTPATTTASTNTHLWNATWTDHLKHDLLMKYDKFARSAQNTSISEVKLRLTILYVDVDEVRSRMVLNTWISMVWVDERLKWNESDYGGLAWLHVADHEVWQPDIVLYNSVLGNSNDRFRHELINVFPSGRILWVLPLQLKVHCDINLRSWPYDRHTCHFFIGSRVYDSEQLILKATGDPPVEVEWWAKPAEWRWKVLYAKEIVRVRNNTGYYESYYSFDVVVTVERGHKAYAAVAFIPAIVCVVLTLAVFWLPPHASEKFLLAGVTAVIECMFLLYFAQRMSAMGQHTPLIVEFYGYSLTLVSMSVVMSVLTGNLSRQPMPRPVPLLISETLNRHAAFFGIPNKKNVSLAMYGRQDCEELLEQSLANQGRTESVDTIHQPTSAQSAQEWIHLALALDRAMFILYIVIFLLITAVFYLS